MLRRQRHRAPVRWLCSPVTAVRADCAHSGRINRVNRYWADSTGRGRWRKGSPSIPAAASDVSRKRRLELAHTRVAELTAETSNCAQLALAHGQIRSERITPSKTSITTQNTVQALKRQAEPWGTYVPLGGTGVRTWGRGSMRASAEDVARTGTGSRGTPCWREGPLRPHPGAPRHYTWTRQAVRR